MTTNVAEILAEHAFFAGLSAADLASIAACGEPREVAAGDMLAHEGGPADTFYVLLDGRVAIETNVPGRAPITLQTLERGDVAGWSWIEDLEWVFSVHAITNCRLIALDAQRLRELLRSDSDLGMEIMRRMMRIIARRLTATRLQLIDIYGKRDDE